MTKALVNMAKAFGQLLGADILFPALQKVYENVPEKA